MTNTFSRVKSLLENSQVKFVVIQVTESPQSFGDAEIITQIGRLYFIFLRDRGQEFILVSEFPKSENAVNFDEALKRVGVLGSESYSAAVSKFEDIWPLILKHLDAF